MLRIEMLPAQEGDCFLISIDNQYHILIDGGTTYTYKHFLKSRLQKLAEENKKINLLIVSHMDNDHIGGIINLINDNGYAENPQIISIEEVWHNSYRHLQLKKNGSLGFQEKEILTSIISSGSTAERMKLFEENEKEISALQGTSLAGMLYSLGYSWNKSLNGLVIKNGFRFNIQDDVYLEVIAPDEKTLADLQKNWKIQLLRNKIDFQFSDDQIFDDAYEYHMRFFKEVDGKEKDVSYKEKDVISIEELATQEYDRDLSVTNNSSICFLLCYKGKKILFLGDICVENLNSCVSQGEYALIKVPHHGSRKNYTTEFAKNIYAERYLVSTNEKKYNHPDEGAIAKMIYYNAEKEKNIYFNDFHAQIKNLFPEKKISAYHAAIHMPDKEEIIVVDIEGEAFCENHSQ